MLDEGEKYLSAAEAKLDSLEQLTPARSNFVGHAERLVIIERDVIADLPNQSEVDIINTRNNAKLLSDTAWRIECACDAQVISRAVSMRKGRGFKDIDHLGVSSTVRKRAKEIGCTPATIFKNAQIFRLIESAENTLSENNTLLRVLNDKGYFVAALSAVDPQEALLIFAKKKTELPRFRVSDAFRLLAKEGLTKKIATMNAIKSARASIPTLAVRKVEIEHIQKTIEKIKTQTIPDCTNPEINRIHEAYLEELNDFMRYFLFDEDVAIAISEAWMKGNHREDEMSKHTGFPVDVVHREMGLLYELGEYIKVSGSGTSQRWHKVGEPLPESLRPHQHDKFKNPGAW